MSTLLELSTCLLISATALGQEAPPAGPATTLPAAESRDGRRTIGRLPANLLRGTVGIFSPADLQPVLMGVGFTGLSFSVDHQVRDHIASPDSRFATSFESIGQATPSGLAAASIFVAGRFVHHQRFRDLGYDLIEVFAVNGLWTTALKQGVRRERPDRSNLLSFPSGHASNAFALATVVERHYGWKAGLPMYVYASAVAGSRLARNKHYLSDVLAGATLGFAVGRSVVRVNGMPLEAPRSPQVSAFPILGPQTLAVAVRLTF